eukprot:5086065-Ditylum_brightwellii.AAC.1
MDLLNIVHKQITFCLSARKKQNIWHKNISRRKSKSKQPRKQHAMQKKKHIRQSPICPTYLPPQT